MLKTLLVTTMLAFAAGSAVAQNIAVVTNGPGTGNPFWAQIEQGIQDAAKDLDVNVSLLSAPRSGDVVGQIRVLEDQLVKTPDGLVLAPVEPDALKSIIADYQAEGIPIVFIDTNIPDSGVTFIGTDNREGAMLAGQYLCDHLPEGASIALLDGIITSTTGRQRSEGTAEAVKACGLNIAAQQSAEWDRAKAVSVMENVLTGNPDLAGVFASNDNMALGAIEALKSANMLDQVTGVGFDANPDAAASILAGEMSASIAQNPHSMGVTGVESVLKLINGETLSPVIDTGVTVVTEENAADYK
jgi:ribose transport system substrate-binding protein